MHPRLYYPLVEGISHTYRVEEPPDRIESVQTVIENVKRLPPNTLAIKRIQQRGNADRSVRIEQCEDGIYEGEGASRQKLFPIPLVDGDSWSYRGEGRWRVKFLTESIRVPAGEFTHC